ncbi:MAG: type II toxin-antitoxin system RelE family toxin [Nitrospiria bacterium]
MTFSILLADRARTGLQNLSEKIHRQIIEDIKGLESNPFPDGKRIKKLRGFKEELYRLRAGDYRIIFQRRSHTVTIIRILAKKDFKKVYG